MSYGRFLYGTLSYGDKQDALRSPDDGTISLMQYLPPYWHTIREMIQLQEVAGQEVNQLKEAIDDLLAQMFIDTATWGLDIWEKELGLTVDPTRPLERRREQIKAKLRGSGTTTAFLIQSVAEAYSGGDVEVIEHPEEYRFTVRFVGVRGVPQNMVGLMQAINEVKPAHLAHDWEYTWTWWDFLADSNLTWDVAGEKTWNELKVYE